MTDSNAATPRKALTLKRRAKKRKPKFVRPESWRYTRLKENWRNPRGLDHAVRLSIKGWPPAASSGYGSPKASRHVHPSGYKETLVYNVEQLSEIEPKTQAVRIAHTVGKRKRIRILAEARRKRIVILNLREATVVPEGPTEKKIEKQTKETGKEIEEVKESGERGEVRLEQKPKKHRGKAKEL